MNIYRLPIEIVSLVVGNLHIDDLFSFGRTCRHFHYLLDDESICRTALKTAAYSAEAQGATVTGRYARGLRRLVQRRNAVRHAEPYAVAEVAWATDYIYTDGYLCYMVTRDFLRVLNVSKSAEKELAVYVPMLLTSLPPAFAKASTWGFKPMYCSGGILVCHYYLGTTPSTRQNWLVILEVESGKLVTCQPLVSARNLLVRSNNKYVVWASKSQLQFDGKRRWAIWVLELKSEHDHESEHVQPSGPLVLWSVCEDEIGVDICFEIIDDEFYCVTNGSQQPPVSGKWNSFYSVVRFRLDTPQRESCESPPIRSLWRRHGTEGPVDKRWNHMKLFKDESSGKVCIFESRREWLAGLTQARRTCYKKELAFETTGDASDRAVFETPTPLMHEGGDLAEYCDPMWDSEAHREDRSPDNFHIGDNGDLASIFTLRECFVRTYVPSCSAFLDLIYKGPDAGNTLQLRVRPKSREDGSGVLAETTSAVNEDCQGKAVFWPPHANTTQPNLAGAHAYKGLQSPKQWKNFHWAMDDRTLIFALTDGKKKGLKRLALVSFDPIPVLAGFQRLRSKVTAECHTWPRPEGRSPAEDAFSGALESPEQQMSEAVEGGMALNDVSAVLGGWVLCDANPPLGFPATPADRLWSKFCEPQYQQLHKRGLSRIGVDDSCQVRGTLARQPVEI